MAEQDRFGGWFGGNKADKVQEKVQDAVPKGSGAEQDRYGGWFGGDKADRVKEAIPREASQGSGAEQDSYGRWFGGDKLPSRADIENRLPKTSGAEQDRYGSHFRPGSTNVGLGGTASTLGLIQHAILPSFGFHSGLSVIAYGIGRYTNKVETKDWLWPSGQVANAWWSAIGIPVVYQGASLSDAWNALSYSQKLLLAGVSAWGIRLFYRIASRSIKRGKDDPRYETAAKKEPNFWNKSFFTMFLPEALAQTLISLPFTLPFRAPIASALAAPVPEASPIVHSIAVFLFSAGYAFEVLADSQLETHSRSGSPNLNREGVWSIVRHPNYLGDALCHFAFPLLLYSVGQMHPLTLLGPVANYIFLRFIGGDRENEESQEKRYSKENPVKYQQLQKYKETKNSFWPNLSEANNKWLWIVAAAGAGGVVLERSLFNFLRS
ncbi:DUF1295-domain-containing protein [Hypoxylon sp. FL1150]|nr:DUF1295-domain-containing protein [Hypoxylon sp. FL1150]